MSKKGNPFLQSEIGCRPEIRHSKELQQDTGFFHPNNSTRQCSNEYFEQSIVNNLQNTVVFAQSMTFSHLKNNVITELGKPLSACITPRFAPANDCVVFVFTKLAFAALPSGTVWVDGFQSYYHIGSRLGRHTPIQTVDGYASGLCAIKLVIT